MADNTKVRDSELDVVSHFEALADRWSEKLVVLSTNEDELSISV